MAYTEHDVRTHFDLLDNTVDNVGRLFRHVVVMFTHLLYGQELDNVAASVSLDLCSAHRAIGAVRTYFIIGGTDNMLDYPANGAPFREDGKWMHRAIAYKNDQQ